MFYTTRDSEQQTFIHFTKSALHVVTFQPWVAGNVPAEKKPRPWIFFGVRDHQRHIDVDVVFNPSCVVFHWISIMYPPWKHKNGKSPFSNWGYIFNGLLLLLLLLLLLWWWLLWWLFASLTSLPPTLEKIFRDIGTEVKRRRPRLNFRVQIPMVLWVSGRCCWLGYVDSNFTGVVSNGCCGYRMHHEFGYAEINNRWSWTWANTYETKLKRQNVQGTIIGRIWHIWISWKLEVEDYKNDSPRCLKQKRLSCLMLLLWMLLFEAQECQKTIVDLFGFY